MKLQPKLKEIKLLTECFLEQLEVIKPVTGQLLRVRGMPTTSGDQLARNTIGFKVRCHLLHPLEALNLHCAFTQA